MIKILKKTKKGLMEELELSLSNAIIFLYELDGNDFNFNDFYVVKNNKEEVEKLKKFFVPEYLLDLEKDVLAVNKNVKKYNRQKNTGANVSAILNFAKKIENTIPLSVVTPEFETEGFWLNITYPLGDIKIYCDYKLAIKKTLAINKENGYIDVEQNDAIVRMINGLFRNQRYYYRHTKKKGKENEIV